MPLLEREYNPNLRQGLCDTAELARAEEEYWQPLVERELESRMQQQNLSLQNFPKLPLALQRRLLRRFAETEGLALDFEHVEKLLRCALGEQPKTELPGRWMALRRGECLELRAPAPEPNRLGYEYTLPIPGEVRIPEVGLTVQAVIVSEKLAQDVGEPDCFLSADLLGPELTLRNWRPGDRFWPVHTGSEEKLKRLFAREAYSRRAATKLAGAAQRPASRLGTGVSSVESVCLGRKRQRGPNRDDLTM